MRKRQLLIISLVAMACILFFDSCKHLRHLHRGDATDSSAVVAHPGGDAAPTPTIQLDTIRNLRYNRYSANFSCTIEGMNINGQVRIQHDSIIWISCTKIFEVARLRFTPTSVQGYSRLLNKYYDGDYASIAKRWGIDLDYATLQSLITGSCPPHCVKTAEPQAKGDSVTLQCTQKVNSYNRTVKMVKKIKNKKMTSALLTTTDVRQTLSCRYSSHQAIGTELAPGIIDISLKCRKGDFSTQLKLSKITLNSAQEYPFSIPERASKL